MTPDQKRAHLTLHGCIVLRLRKEISNKGWRIVKDGFIVNDSALVFDVYVRRDFFWQLRPDMMAGRESYREVPIEAIPDDELNQLPVKLIASYLRHDP